jgi:hypothetical protein
MIEFLLVVYALSLQILLPSQLSIVSITSVHFTHVFALLDARLLEHLNSNPKDTLATLFLSLFLFVFFLPLTKMKVYGARDFRKGGKEADARAGYSYASPTF